MNIRFSLFFLFGLFILSGCSKKLTQSSTQRTYKFVVIPQNSKIQFFFNDGMDYGALTNITLPNWEGCSGDYKRGAFTDCTRKSLENYINDQFQIPQIALDSVVEGKVGFQFRLDENGEISNGKITNNPGGGLAEEMERTLLSILQLKPAEINSGNFVASEITLEVYCDIVLR